MKTLHFVIFVIVALFCGFPAVAAAAPYRPYYTGEDLDQPLNWSESSTAAANQPLGSFPERLESSKVLKGNPRSITETQLLLGIIKDPASIPTVLEIPETDEQASADEHKAYSSALAGLVLSFGLVLVGAFFATHW